MEILYIKIDDKKNDGYTDQVIFENVLEMNLNSNYLFEFKDDKIIGKMKNIYPENFFGNKIQNISCIVGNNGSGKSVYLNKLADSLTRKHNYLRILVVTKEEDEYRVYLSEYCENIHISFSDNIKMKDITEFFSKIDIVYYSNMFEQNYYQYNRDDNLIDISTIGIINSNNLEIQSKTDKIQYFFNKEFEKQLKYYTDFSENLPFEIPHHIIVFLTNIDYEFKILKNQYKSNKEYISFFEEFEKNIIFGNYAYLENYSDINLKKIEENINLNDKEYSQNSSSAISLDKAPIFEYKIVSLIIFSIFLYFIFDSLEYRKRDNIMSLVKKFKNLNIEKNKCLNFTLIQLEKLQHELIENSSGIKSSQNEYIKICIDFIKFLNENYKNFIDFGSVNHGRFVIDTNKCEHKKFFEFYFKLNTVIPIFKFKWYLSSGQNVLLSIYARLYDIYLKKVEGEYILMLMDELDNTLHPKWQQEIVNNLVNNLPRIFKNKNIQIIFATHSPIIISDIPVGNITFLKKDKETNSLKQLVHNETFSANIQSLYYDSFFLDKGSIGEFAKEKINKLIKAMVNFDNYEPIYSTPDSIKNKLNLTDINEIDMLINLVGEPVVKQKLKEIYSKCKKEEFNND